jgi:hypothetical protein
MWSWIRNHSLKSSREQIAIKEVREGILCLPKNRYCTMLEVSAVNFELKSEEEQDVLIDSFQTFLNSLPCELQILVRVREVDIDQYLERVTLQSANESEDIYKQQLAKYAEFVSELVSGNKILSRRFYVVIPFHDNSGDFALIKEQLQLHKDIIAKGLEKLGMKAISLSSLQVLELFYSFYNPAQHKTQTLKQSALSALKNAYV